MSRKLTFKWLDQYQICNSVKDKGTYMLEELDRSRLAGTFAGDRLKKFHPQQRLQLDNAPDLGEEEIPTLDNFPASDDDSDLSDTTPNNFDI